MAASSPSQMVALATKILAEARTLEAYHLQNDIPVPSFEEHGYVEHDIPVEWEEKRNAIADACQELGALVQGPRKHLHTGAYVHIIYLDVIHRFKIPQKVPKDGRISYADLAESIGLGETPLRRVLRGAMANHIFAELDDGFVSHSASSRLLAEDETFFDWLGANLQEVRPAAAAEGKALEKWPAADEGSQTGYMLAHNATGPSFYLHMAKDPERIRQFSNAMKAFAQGKGSSLSHLVDNYPWQDLKGGTVVDLGGSTGATAFAIAEKNPNLHFVVQDLAKTIVEARERPSVNVKFMAHSFFEEQPVKGADVYMSRWCFHNFSDKYCLQILNALIPALKPGARILIMDAVLPGIRDKDILPSVHRYKRNYDLNMMSMSNSFERELSDWKTLFASADPRFRFKGIVEPKGSNLALIEAAWEP